ncbi:MAG: glycosyltransferase family 4 protein [Bacteroidetes bacterium]|nr:glycosyltransferase family 4 protein [Bacteroidota bacterium]
MHIAIITNEYVTEPNFDGGFANHFYKLAIGFRDLGHDVSVFTKSDENGALLHEGIDVQRVKPSWVWYLKVLDILLRFNFSRALTSLALSHSVRLRLKEIHKTKKIDVSLYPSVNGIASYKFPNVPTVILAGSSTKLWEEANGIYNKTIKKRQLQIIEHLIYKREKHIYAPSHFLANYLSKVFKKPIRVIETPFKKLDTHSYELGLLDSIKEKTCGKPYLLFFGRLGLWKGTIDIADALPSILSAHPDLFFVFIGKDKGYQGSNVVDYINEKSIPHDSRVLCYPPVKHESLFPIIENAHGVLLPSRAENLSNASIETMSMGKILIGTRGASFDQLIDDNKNGFLCDIADPDSIVNAVGRLMKLSEEERIAMSNKAQKRIDLLHPNLVVQEVVDFFEEVILGENK